MWLHSLLDGLHKPQLTYQAQPLLQLRIYQMDSISTLKGWFLRGSFTRKNTHLKLSSKNTNTMRGFNKRKKFHSWPRINCHLRLPQCFQASNATHLDLNLFWQLVITAIQPTLIMLTLSISRKHFSNNHIQHLKATIRYRCLNRT